jgi:phosphoenolpyruvate carboxylase
MSLTTTAPGKHTAAYRELEARLAQVEADNQALIARNEELVCELTSTILSASRYSLRAAAAEDENGRLLKANADLRHTTIRAKAEQERLRQAVVNARPKLHPVPTDLVRPFAPVVVLPYVSPVPHRSTANDETQQLPVLDRPQPAVWPVYAMPATT